MVRFLCSETQSASERKVALAIDDIPSQGGSLSDFLLFPSHCISISQTIDISMADSEYINMSHILIVVFYHQTIGMMLDISLCQRWMMSIF